MHRDVNYNEQHRLNFTCTNVMYFLIVSSFTYLLYTLVMTQCNLNQSSTNTAIHPEFLTIKEVDTVF